MERRRFDAKFSNFNCVAEREVFNLNEFAENVPGFHVDFLFVDPPHLYGNMGSKFSC